MPLSKFKRRKPSGSRVLDLNPAISILNSIRKMDLSKLKSRKLWATIIGTIIVSVGGSIGLSPDAVTPLAAMISAYVLGQGIADAGSQGKADKP